jgi:hypothetical protein
MSKIRYLGGGGDGTCSLAGKSRRNPGLFDTRRTGICTTVLDHQQQPTTRTGMALWAAAASHRFGAELPNELCGHIGNRTMRD